MMNVVRLFFVFFLLCIAAPSVVLAETAVDQTALAKKTAAETKSTSVSKQQEQKKNVETSMTIGSAIPKLDSLVMQMIKGLIYCLGLLLILVAIYKKLHPNGAGSADDPIRIIARKGIGPKAALILIEAENKTLLISHSGDNVSLISALKENSDFEAELQRSLSAEQVSVADKPQPHLVNHG